MLRKKAYHIHLLRTIEAMVDREMDNIQNKNDQQLFMKQGPNKQNEWDDQQINEE